MSRYFEPIKIAIITFPFIAALFTLPFMIYQYKKHGYINKIRTVVLYSLLLFLISAYYLVILPLPKIHTVAAMQGTITQYMQLTPFTFVLDFLKETNVVWNNPKTYLSVIKERALLQAVFNVVLLMPLGIYCRYYFRMSLKKTVLMTFLLSLFFEITQLTGLYGIYRAPYRLFDVDDLMLNTFGGLVGYLAAPKITFFLPASDKYDIGIDFSKMQVGFIRRTLAECIDAAVCLSIALALQNGNKILIMIPAYYILLPYITNGFTVGRWIVRIRLQSNEGRLKLIQILKRNFLLYSTLVMAGVLLIIPFIGIPFDLMLSAYILYKVINNDRILFYERMSGTKNVVAFKQKHNTIKENKDEISKNSNNFNSTVLKSN